MYLPFGKIKENPQGGRIIFLIIGHPQKWQIVVVRDSFRSAPLDYTFKYIYREALKIYCTFVEGSL